MKGVWSSARLFSDPDGPPSQVNGHMHLEEGGGRGGGGRKIDFIRPS